jgi:hypothetical protein
MPSITLFEGSIATALIVRHDSEALPIVLKIDGDALRPTLDEASKLARAGERIERALFKSTQAPKESVAVFQHKIGFPDGTAGAFEIRIAIDPIGVAVVWNKKQLRLDLGAIAESPFALARICEAAADIRRASGPPRVRCNVIG